MDMEWLYLVGGSVVGFVLVSKLLGGTKKPQTAHERLKEIEHRESALVAPREDRVVDGVPVSGEVLRLVAAGRKMPAIQRLRSETGLGLSEAKLICDKLFLESSIL